MIPGESIGKFPIILIYLAMLFIAGWVDGWHKPLFPKTKK